MCDATDPNERTGCGMHEKLDAWRLMGLLLVRSGLCPHLNTLAHIPHAKAER